VSTGRKIATLPWHERARIYKRNLSPVLFAAKQRRGWKGNLGTKNLSFSNEKLIALAQKARVKKEKERLTP